MLWQTRSIKKRKKSEEKKKEEVLSEKIRTSTWVWVRQQALTEVALPTQSSRKTSCKYLGPAETLCPEEAVKGGPLWSSAEDGHSH